MQHAFVLKHHPLITPRIDFRPAPPPDVPVLTTRIDYTPDHFKIGRLESSVAHQPSQLHRERSCTPELLSSVQRSRSPSEDGESQARLSAPAQPSTSALIFEPSGQPGRPGSGGYCLEDVLRQTHGWTKSSIDRFNVSSFYSLLATVT